MDATKVELQSVETCYMLHRNLPVEVIPNNHLHYLIFVLSYKATNFFYSPSLLIPSLSLTMLLAMILAKMTLH